MRVRLRIAFIARHRAMDFNSLPEQDRLFLNRLIAADLAGDATGCDTSQTVDELRLAAWLEGQFDEITASPIEEALLRNPGLLGDLLTISLSVAAYPPVDATVLGRACALVAETGQTTAQVVPFIRPAVVHPRLLRDLLPWGAVAACVALISVVGFNLGSIVGKSEVSLSSSSDLWMVMNDDLD